jgi:hypothetical protein
MRNNLQHISLLSGMMFDFKTIFSIKRFAVLACGVCWLSAMPTAETRASEWMFRRSYYSHNLPPEYAAHFPRPRSLSAYRRPYVGTGPGFAVRGGYRINRVFLRSGNSTDTTILYESWFQFLP